MNSLFLFMMLDLNQIFSFGMQVENQYYLEACNHAEFYISYLERFARHHALEKLQEIQRSNSQMMSDVGDGAELERLISSQRELLGDPDT
jgi:hypothetical protein